MAQIIPPPRSLCAWTAEYGAQIHSSRSPPSSSRGLGAPTAVSPWAMQTAAWDASRDAAAAVSSHPRALRGPGPGKYL